MADERNKPPLHLLDSSEKTNIRPKIGLGLPPVFGWLCIVFCVACSGALAQKKSRSRGTPVASDTTTWRQAVVPFTRGIVLFSQGLVEEAADFLDKAAEVAPNSAGIHYYLARIAYAQGDPIRMLVHAEKAYAEAPDELWIALGYAAALQLNNQLREACSLLEKLLREHPDHPEIVFRLAQAYQSAGDVDKADLYYARFQYLTGSYEETFQTRIHLLIEKGRVHQAISLAESLAAIFPRHEVYLETAVRLYELQRDLRGMASATARLLGMDPANPVGWEVVLSYPELFEEMWGEESMERLLETPGVPTEVKYAILRRTDFLEEEELLPVLRKLLAEAPSANGWDLYARYWAYKGHWDSAAYGWKAAITLDSMQLTIYMDYFYALWRLGGGDSLLREVRRASELMPGQGRLYLWEAIALTLTRSPEAALPLFQRGWRLVQNIDTTHAQIAMYYQAIAELMVGRPSSQTRQRFLTLYPSFGDILWDILAMRQGAMPSSAVNPEVAPPPYREWWHLARAIRRGNLNEAYTHALQATTSSTPLPLEMWEDILLRTVQNRQDKRYAEWKQQAKTSYPLAEIWKELP